MRDDLLSSFLVTNCVEDDKEDVEGDGDGSSSPAGVEYDFEL